jgi:K+-sensing histidine kinase KdpD
MMSPVRRAVIFAAAAASLAAVTALGSFFRFNASTVGFAYLIVVLMISLWGGLLAGTLFSVVAALCYNFFFFPPLRTLTIAEPENWFALAAFLIASVTVNRLVVAARVQAEKAEQRRMELETLYVERERFIEENAHVEALRESESLKTSLLRAISHDLATPITAITIRTESLRRRAGRLRRRIDNLLSMARLEAGKAKPRREPTPPADLFRAARENLPLVVAARPVSVHVDDDCPDANVDPSLALEILVNLIENAHRVSPAGAPIELAARRHPATWRSAAWDWRSRAVWRL